MLAEPRHARVEPRRLVPEIPAAEVACQGRRWKVSRHSRLLSKNSSGRLRTGPAQSAASSRRGIGPIRLPSSVISATLTQRSPGAMATGRAARLRRTLRTGLGIMQLAMRSARPPRPPEIARSKWVQLDEPSRNCKARGDPHVSAAGDVLQEFGERADPAGPANDTKVDAD